MNVPRTANRVSRPVRIAPRVAPTTAPTNARKHSDIAGVKAAALGTNAIRAIAKLIELRVIPFLLLANLPLP
ncbi:MAG: hypothetical protein ACI9XC_002684 [Gammaproteobacteria bacterium]|jgi:hypothetical protein